MEWCVPSFSFPRARSRNIYSVLTFGGILEEAKRARAQLSSVLKVCERTGTHTSGMVAGRESVTGGSLGMHSVSMKTTRLQTAVALAVAKSFIATSCNTRAASSACVERSHSFFIV